MARYFKVDLSLPEREEALLVPTVRTVEMGLIPGTFNQIAPGLYPGEETLRLDTDAFIALSVQTHWLENGEGVSFHASARWIEEDGSTKVTEKDQPIKAGFSVTIPAIMAIKYGVDALATDAARIVLGEEPLVMETVPMGEGEEPIEVPVINLSPEVKANASIRDQISLVEQVREFPKLSL